MPRRRKKKPPASLLDFPATLSLRATGHNQPGFVDQVLAALRTCQPNLSEAALSVRPSRECKYLAVTIRLTVADQAELDALYGALHRVEGLIIAF